MVERLLVDLLKHFLVLRGVCLIFGFPYFEYLQKKALCSLRAPRICWFRIAFSQNWTQTPFRSTGTTAEPPLTATISRGLGKTPLLRGDGLSTTMAQTAIFLALPE